MINFYPDFINCTLDDVYSDYNRSATVSQVAGRLVSESKDCFVLRGELYMCNYFHCSNSTFFFTSIDFSGPPPSLPINCKGRRHILLIFIRISLSFFFQEERTVCNCCWIHVFVHMTFIHFVVESNFCTFCRITSFDCDIHILIVVEFGCFYGIFLFTQN